MNKKHLFAALLLFVGSMTPQNTMAEVPIGDLVYAIPDDTYACVLRLNNSNITNLVIPDHVVYEGITMPVVTIQESAFDGCTNLTSVTIPYTMQIIYNEAFDNCTNIQEVIFEGLPENYTPEPRLNTSECWDFHSVRVGCNPEGFGIYDGMFEESEALEYVYIGKNIEILDDEAGEEAKCFENSNVQTVEIGPGVPPFRFICSTTVKVLQMSTCQMRQV